MKRTITILALHLALIASAFAQEPKPKPAEPAKPEAAKPEAAKPAGPTKATPTADQILEKYVQSIGGKAAIEKLNSRTTKASFEIPAMGATGTVESYEKAPNKSIAIINIPGFGIIQEGYNGTIAWSQDPTSGMREKAGVELADTKLESEFHRAIKLKQLYPTMTVKGTEKVGDKEAYVIEAVPAEGSTEKWYFDTQTGLLLRTDATRESPMGKVPTEVYFEDYREVDGVKIPFVVRISNPMFVINIKNEEVKHNVAVDDAKFNKPAAQ